MRGCAEAPAPTGRAARLAAGLLLGLLATHRVRRGVPDEVDRAPLAVDTAKVTAALPVPAAPFSRT